MRHIVLVFDEKNPNWTGDYEFNAMFISHELKFLNEVILPSYNVTVNDIYKLLGVHRKYPLKEDYLYGIKRGHKIVTTITTWFDQKTKTITAMMIEFDAEPLFDKEP